MIQSTQKTPIWLEMKPDFIDENFDKVVDYLSTSNTTRDNFYYETLSLLEKRIRIVFAKMQSTPIHLDDGRHLGTDSREQLIYEVKLLLTFLLSTDIEKSIRRSVLYALFADLAKLEPAYSEQLMLLQINVLINERIDQYHFTWEDVHKLQSQILINRLIQYSKDKNKQSNPFFYTKHGLVQVEKGIINLAPNRKAYESNKIAKTAPAFSILEDHIRLYVEKGDRIKATDLADFDKVKDFIENVCDLQSKCKDSSLKSYKEGEIMEVVVIRNQKGQIGVRTTDSSYEIIEGSLDFNFINHKCSITYDYHADDFCKALEVGDLIEVQLESKEKCTFSIFEPFEECHTNDPDVGAVSLVGHESKAWAAAIWRDANSGIDRIRWISEEGIILQSFADEGIAQGDYAILEIDDVVGGFVNATIKDTVCAEFDVEKAQIAFIQTYSHGHKEDVLTQGRSLDEIDIRSLLTTLHIYQQQVTDITERNLILCIIRFLCVLVGNNTDAEYITLVQTYYKNLTYFANNTKPIQEITASDELKQIADVQRRIEILNILRSCSNEADADWLQNLLDNTEDELLLKLAKLVQSYNNLLSATGDKVLNFIRKEILSSLAIATDETIDLETNNNDYLGDESKTVEFKSSFVYPPDNQMQADEDIQMRNIMRGLCAFLNTTLGGTLYIGVNDAGRVVSLQDDMRYLHKDSMDAYLRHIQDTIKPFFPSEYSCFDICEEMEGRVIAIHVSPYQYGVAKLEGKAYKRWGNENRLMTIAEIEKLTNERQFKDEKKVRNIVNLLSAIESKQQVILHNYASNNSASQRDRLVEAFAITEDNTNVWCYEIDSDKVKLFTIARIGNIEITKNSWSHISKHIKGEMDIFKMTGTTPIHIVLSLDMMARNLLVEEYPLAKDDITEDKNNDKWTLDTKIYNIRGIGRFVIGLLEHIQIIQGDELKTYIKDYLTTGLKSL